MTATMARMSLVTALQQANVRAPYTSPEKLGLMSPEKLGLTQDAPSAQNQDGERGATCEVRRPRDRNTSVAGTSGGP